MIKQFLPTIATLVALSAAATPVATNPIGLRDMDPDAILATQSSRQPRMAPPFRSVEDPQGTFTANNAVFWNYGDMLGNGTNIYGLALSNMPLDKGYPTAEGQMCRLELVADVAANLEDPLPDGTYTCVDLSSMDVLVPGTLIGPDSYFMDVFLNPDDPTSDELYCYQWTVTSGSVTIEKIADPEGDAKYPRYSVTCQMHGEIVDEETGELFDERDLSATYEGEIIYDDPNAYTPLGEDIQMDIPNLSGRHMSSGEYYLAFYSVPLDEEGSILGAGHLFNVVFLTENYGPMDCDVLVGTFSHCDTFTDYQPGTYAEGFWYNLYGWYVAMGTELSIYDEMAEVDRVGLAVDGTITGTKVSDGIYHFDFDLVTPEGDKMTGSWEGCMKDYVEDYAPNSVDETSLGAKGTVKADCGFIDAPEGARVFNTAGIETGTRDLAPGVYIVRMADHVVKVVVR